MEKNAGGGGGSSSSNDDYFFKIMRGNFKETLGIPQAFIKQFTQNSQSSNRAILEGPSGSCWHVKLKISTNGMYFEDGWEAFSRDHSLQKNDFLLFKYDGNMQFKVIIFDTSACQREDAFTAKPSQESTICEGRKTCDRPPRGFMKARYETRSKSYSDPSHPSLPLQKKRRTYLKSKRQDEIPSSSKQGRRMVLEDRERGEAARSFRSDFHFFVTRLKQSNVVKPFNLTIPVFFARLHLPPRTTMLKLRDKKGKTWRVNCYARESNDLVRASQYALCGGWKAFVTDNDLKKGDYLIFELVEARVMQFHIY